MSRTRTIIYVALLLVAVLAFAFAVQFRRVQQQLRTSVRIVPEEQKSRGDIAEQELREGMSPRRPNMLVRFRRGITRQAAQEVAARFHDQILDEIEAVPGLMTIDSQNNTDPVQYQGLHEVAYAELNYAISIDDRNATANESAAGVQWYVLRTSLSQAWAKTTGSHDVVTAVLDTGVDYNHPDLAKNIWTRPDNISPFKDDDLGVVDDVHGYNAITNEGDPFDENGHGTEMAGIVGSECAQERGTCGVSPNVSMLALKVLNAGGFGTVGNAVAALNYAVDRKRSGVNLCAITIGWNLQQRSRALEDALRGAGDAGILVIVASGNNKSETVGYPAGYQLDNLIVVAASNQNDQLASFSNYGNQVQLAAPGQDILTTVLGNEHAQHSDTALAAAFVTGVAALLRSVNPRASVSQLRAILLNSVEQVPGLKGKVATGGRINAARAVNAAVALPKQ